MKFLESEIRPFCFPKTPTLRENISIPNGEERLAARIEIKKFLHDLPEVKPEQAIALGTQKILDPLKKEKVWGFDNKWNKLTAEAAAQSLGWPTDHLVRILKKDTPLAQKLKQQQTEIAQAWEQACRLKLAERISQISPEVAKQAWVQNKFEICDRLWQEITKTKSNTPERIKFSAVGILVDFINRFGEQSFNRSDLLRKVLTAVAENQPIVVLNLFCPPFTNSLEGINVTQLKDPMTVFRKGKGEIVCLRDFVFADEIFSVKAIFEHNGIDCNIISPIIDLDAFVMEDQEKILAQNCLTLRDRFPEMKACHLSEILEIPSLNDPKNNIIQNEWQRRLAQTDKLTTRLVDQMFDKLQRRDLPSEMKTREFAVFMAKRRFICHFLIGQKIPELFPNGIVLLRGMGSEVTEVDKIGAKSVGKNFFVVTHT